VVAVSASRSATNTFDRPTTVSLRLAIAPAMPHCASVAMPWCSSAFHRWAAPV